MTLCTGKYTIFWKSLLSLAPDQDHFHPQFGGRKILQNVTIYKLTLWHVLQALKLYEHCTQNLKSHIVLISTFILFKRTLLDIFKSSRMCFGETVADSSKDCSAFTFSVKQSKQCEENTLDCLGLKINELVTCETSGSIYRTTQCHITDDLNLQEHYCDNLNITPKI
jgi:hypothetical protein